MFPLSSISALPRRLSLFVAIAIVALTQPAWAQQHAKPQQTNSDFDWSGIYYGGHVGYTRGKARAGITELNFDENADPSFDAPPPPPTQVSDRFRSPIGSLNGGVQAGYNYVLPSHLLLGVEADASFLNFLASDDVAWSRVGSSAEYAEKIDYMATMRARLGRTMGHWMVYATGGFALSNGRFLATPGASDDIDKALHHHTGWVVGAGGEMAIAPSWMLRLEYLYYNFGHAAVTFPSGATAESSYDVHTIRLGLNYKPDWTGRSASLSSNSPSQSPYWEIHGQTTYSPGLSGIQIALSGGQQLHALGTGPADVVEQRIHRRSAVAGRRALLQS